MNRERAPSYPFTKRKPIPLFSPLISRGGLPQASSIKHTTVSGHDVEDQNYRTPVGDILDEVRSFEGCESLDGDLDKGILCNLPADTHGEF